MAKLRSPAAVLPAARMLTAFPKQIVVERERDPDEAVGHTSERTAWGDGHPCLVEKGRCKLHAGQPGRAEVHECVERALGHDRDQAVGLEQLHDLIPAPLVGLDHVSDRCLWLGQGCHRSGLRDRRRARDERLLQLLHGVDDVAWRDCVADSPSCHRVGLGDSRDADHVAAELTHRGVLAVEDDVLIDLVGDECHAGLTR